LSEFSRASAPTKKQKWFNFWLLCIVCRELYKQHIVTEKVMQSCLSKFFRALKESDAGEDGTNHKEDAVESICKLLSTIGQVNLCVCVCCLVCLCFELQLLLFLPGSSITFFRSQKVFCAHDIDFSSLSQMLDAKAPTALDSYLQELDALKTLVSSRVRFAVLDLQDLRKSGWAVSKHQLQPKKLDEIKV
jgi:hypothetical protein